MSEAVCKYRVISMRDRERDMQIEKERVFFKINVHVWVERCDARELSRPLPDDRRHKENGKWGVCVILRELLTEQKETGRGRQKMR